MLYNAIPNAEALVSPCCCAGISADALQHVDLFEGFMVLQMGSSSWCSDSTTLRTGDAFSIGIQEKQWLLVPLVLSYFSARYRA